VSGEPPLVGVIMGSISDWEVMRHASETLERLGVAHETRVVSAHRTPDLLYAYAETAEARGLQVLIAGAGGAAHLPGMAAAKSLLPVLGVPMPSDGTYNWDSHAVNCHLFNDARVRLPYYDRAVTVTPPAGSHATPMFRSDDPRRLCSGCCGLRPAHRAGRP